MGLGHKSHGKKSNKGTQSPLLKIFEDMMHKEKNDPEKTNLLNVTQVEQKRKHYSSSRSKSGHKTLDSSSSERHKQKKSFSNVQQETRNAEFDPCRTQSIPFQNEKRDSWWFWGDKPAGPEIKSQAEDTCSCVSCALKKIVSTEYACIGCLAILFAISVIVAIMLVYKSVPCMTNVQPAKDYNKMKIPRLEDRLKRKIDGGGWGFGAKKSWSNPFSRAQGPAFGSFKFQDMSYAESDNDLSKLLNADKMNEIQNSDQLRDFYKKLIQTDAAIRNLRKTLNEKSNFNADHYDVNSNIDFSNENDFNNPNVLNRQGDLNYNSDRTKRSLLHRPKVLHYKKRDKQVRPIIEKGKIMTKTTVNMDTNKKNNKPQRNKRFNDLNDTEGFVIEKNQVVIQYKPIPNRLVAKCSHAPKNSNSHENQLKHPFYKNTQRLDELLDQFIDKRLPDLISNNFGMINEQKKKCKHPQTEETTVVNNDEQNSEKDKEVLVELPVDKKVVKEETTVESTENAKNDDAFENYFFEDSEGVDNKKERSTSSPYDLLLSVSTVFNSDMKTTSGFPASVLIDRVPNLRKLMQIDVDEDQSIGYEDFKEVLADHKESHDENDKESYRKKRNDESHSNSFDPALKHYPNSVHNPNWKGPMPLYPEELNQMIKQGPYSDDNVPMHNTDFAPKADKSDLSLTDVQYFEDYIDNGNEKLVELAQAYSDYGVLDEKRGNGAEKKIEQKGDHKLEDRGAKMTSKEFKPFIKDELNKKGIFGRTRTGKGLEEGIRIEIQPTAEVDESAADLYKMLRKHVKITSFPHQGKPHRFSSFIPTPSGHFSELGIEIPKFLPDAKTDGKSGHSGNEIIFTVNKKRTLKSMDFEKNTADLRDDTTKITDIFGNFEHVMSKFKRDTARTSQTDAKNTNVTNATNIINIDDITLKKTLRKDENVTREKYNVNQKLGNDNMTLSDIFMLLSNWFKALDANELNKVTMPAPDQPRSDSIGLEKHSNINNVTNGMAFPVYDSDMIENIGHRSRVLLSIDDNNNITKTDDVKTENVEVQHLELSSSTEPMNNANITNTIQDTTPFIENTLTDKISTKHHKAKRQAAEDSNLIFWNDLYDDEYGIKVDPFENNIRDKHSVNKNDFVQRSNLWIQDKVKSITDKLNMAYFRKDGRRIVREAKTNGQQRVQRVTRSLEDEEESGGSSKIDFDALTAKMKEVCKKTAKIVQQTKNIQVREENKEDHVASSLMQQLVRLMTDLVDFQVQERTCRKLPSDLQNFLEWLTSSKSGEETDLEPYLPENKVDEQPDIAFDKSTEREHDLFLPSERDSADSRTDCLGTLHVVQDLIQQYDHMSDDEKNIMPGVKTYLENQMDFLQRQISAIDEQTVYSKDARYRRDVITDIGHKVANAIDATAQTVEHEYKNLKHMYRKYMKKMKHVSKQVTKTTKSMKESASTIFKKIGQDTKQKHKTHKSKEKLKDNHAKLNEEKDKDQKCFIHPKIHSKDKHENIKDHKNKNNQNNIDHCKDKMIVKDKDSDRSEINLNVKTKDIASNKHVRNIKDVYFKALEEAKKGTTVKSYHNNHESKLFEKADIPRNSQ